MNKIIAYEHRRIVGYNWEGKPIEEYYGYGYCGWRVLENKRKKNPK